MIAILNGIIAGIGGMMGALLNLLPTSPFALIVGLDNFWINIMNYWLPVNSMVAHLELYVSAVAAYYLIRVVLRWVKAVGA
ncbi:MAG TPA: hypothetical protein VFD03_04415 [Clostridia bacterium]|nr:hypothetical protein [Clostridia bacterium]